MSSSESKKTNKAKPAVSVKMVASEATDVQSKKPEKSTVRCLKLKSFYRESSSKILHKPAPTVVPELRLCGMWLEEAGFVSESYVNVTVMEGLLVIRASEVAST